MKEEKYSINGVKIRIVYREQSKANPDKKPIPGTNIVDFTLYEDHGSGREARNGRYNGSWIEDVAGNECIKAYAQFKAKHAAK